MKIRTLIAGNAVLFLIAGLSAQAAEMTKLAAKPGSKMRVEGTSNIHDWQVESPLIAGIIEVGPNFPVTPGQNVSPGPVEASGDVFIAARSLRSVKKDGSAYDDKMDDVMYTHLKAQENPRITYKLKELTLKEAPKSKDAPYVFDSKGEVTVAGVTKAVDMPVNVLPAADGKIKISGSVPLKMTDFKVEPPAPKIALGLIKTGDDIKVIFDWMVAPRK